MRISKYTPEGYIIKEIDTINILRDVIQRHDFRRKSMWIKFVEYLKKRLIGKVCSFPVLAEDENGIPESHRAGHWYIDDIYLDEKFKVHMVGHGFFSNVNNKFDVILYIDGGDMNKIYYEDKPDPVNPLDPYGEEDWENEKLITKFNRFYDKRI